MKGFPLLILVAIALSAPKPCYASANLWTIDPEHSAVTFRVKHLALGSVNGQFKKVSGTVSYDGKNLRDAAIEAAIDSQSVDTQSNSRDEHLRSKTFLNVSEFPSMTFKSQKIIPGEAGAFKIKGIISIHGYAREVSFDAQPLKELKSDTGEKLLVTSATTRLDRKDFGISAGVLDKGGALIGDAVQVVLNIQLVNSKSTAGPSSPFHHSGGELKMHLIRVALAPLYGSLSGASQG